jgi:hypothetical protein
LVTENVIVMSSADEKASVASASPSSIIRVPLIELENAVEQAFASGKTPLVVDTSDEDRVCTFYSYQFDVSLLEAKQIVLTGIRASPQEALEPFRRLLVNAMKFGKTLVVRLANSAPSLHSKWNDEALRIDNRDPASAFFPADVLYEGGQRLHGTVWPERLFREADMFPHKNVTYCL